MVIGGIVAGAGGLAGSIGALMALVGASNAGLNCDSYQNTRYYYSKEECLRRKHDGPGVRDAGLVTLGIGAAVGVAGLFVFLSSAKTDVEQHSKGGGEAPRDAFVREPAWKSVASSAESATPAPGASFPIVFTGHF
jgi:hypothetical protein